MSTFLQQTLNGLSIGSVYVLVGVGLTLVFGVSRIINYAQGQFLVLGAFLGYAIVAAGAPLWLAFFIAPLGVGALGVALYFTVFRRMADDFLGMFILTIGLGIVIQQLIVEIWSPEQTQISSGLNDSSVDVGGVILTDSRLLMFGVSAVVVVALIWWLWKSSMGRTIRATAENRDVAALLGINPALTASSAFLVGSALAGLAGVLLGILFPFTPFSGGAFLIKGLAVALAGGMGNVLGAVVVGLTVGLVETYASSYGVPLGFTTLGSQFQDAYAFILLVVILAWRPQGLFRGTGEL